MKTRLLLLLPLALLCACDALPSWLSGPKKHEPKLAGERIAVLSNAASLQPDESLASSGIEIPAAETNANWAQHGGNAQAFPGHPALPATLQEHRTATIGDGHRFTIRMTISPVVAEGSVYAMDAVGIISAHDAKDIEDIRWISPGAANDEKEPILGGGLAYDAGRLYATSGRGAVVALDAANGNELWRQALNIPIRSAPRVEGGRIYIVTVDSQLFALDAATGTVLWNHRGINEGAGFLIEATPAAVDELTVAPYSSGEIYALHADGGDEAWSDTLLSAQKQSASGQFTGIGGDPVVADGALYVAGSAGQLAAFQLQSGRRLWEQPMSSVNTPALVGDYLCVLTVDAQLILLSRADGRVKWVRQLAQYDDPEERKKPYLWSGPVLAGGRLLVAGAHGELSAFDPASGNLISQDDIPKGVTAAPVVANNTLYFVTDNAKLHTLY